MVSIFKIAEFIFIPFSLISTFSGLINCTGQVFFIYKTFSQRLCERRYNFSPTKKYIDL